MFYSQKSNPFSAVSIFIFSFKTLDLAILQQFSEISNPIYFLSRFTDATAVVPLPINGSNTISLWGDGTPSRDFLHISDAARGVILAAENYNNTEPVNLGSQKEITIKKLATMICNIMKFDGEIVWDTSKPNGQPRRCVSYEKAEKEFGFKPKIEFEYGLKETVDWFLNKKL